jgi:hypothetical protein
MPCLLGRTASAACAACHASEARNAELLVSSCSLSCTDSHGQHTLSRTTHSANIWWVGIGAADRQICMHTCVGLLCGLLLCSVRLARVVMLLVLLGCCCGCFLLQAGNHCCLVCFRQRSYFFLWVMCLQHKQAYVPQLETCQDMCLLVCPVQRKYV